MAVHMHTRRSVTINPSHFIYSNLKPIFATLTCQASHAPAVTRFLHDGVTDGIVIVTGLEHYRLVLVHRQCLTEQFLIDILYVSSLY